MQLMPATAAQLGVTNPFDPTQNITAGISYLKALLTQFGGDTASALAAYNWGPGNVAAAQAAYGDSWLNYAPSETQNYLTKIMGQLGLPLPGGSSGTGGGWDLSSLSDPTTLIFAGARGLWHSTICGRREGNPFLQITSPCLRFRQILERISHHVA